MRGQMQPTREAVYPAIKSWQAVALTIALKAQKNTWTPSSLAALGFETPGRVVTPCSDGPLVSGWVVLGP
jgi:hypothetical protein